MYASICGSLKINFYEGGLSPIVYVLSLTIKKFDKVATKFDFNGFGCI